MVKNLSYRPLALVGLFALTTVLAACAATPNDPASPRVQTYTTQECKQMHGRGVINLEQKRKCDMGMPIGTENQVNP